MDDKRVAYAAFRIAEMKRLNMLLDPVHEEMSALLDALTTAHARIAELQALEEWRTDWENAPKDNTVMLGSDGPGTGWYTIIWSNVMMMWINGDDQQCSPTHYRLITPPEKSHEQDGSPL